MSANISLLILHLTLMLQHGDKIHQITKSQVSPPTAFIKLTSFGFYEVHCEPFLPFGKVFEAREEF
jgi:hypothetical protein